MSPVDVCSPLPHETHFVDFLFLTYACVKNTHARIGQAGQANGSQQWSARNEVSAQGKKTAVRLTSMTPHDFRLWMNTVLG
jgi:hypothetical protein